MSVIEAPTVEEVTPTTYSPKECVERGAAFMDDIDPDWHRVIDITRLDMALGCDCIMGQLYSDRNQTLQTGWGWAMEHYGLGKFHGNDFDGHPRTVGEYLGFTSSCCTVGSHWHTLDRQWERAIRERMAS